MAHNTMGGAWALKLPHLLVIYKNVYLSVNRLFISNIAQIFYFDYTAFPKTLPFFTNFFLANLMLERYIFLQSGFLYNTLDASKSPARYRKVERGRPHSAAAAVPVMAPAFHRW